MIPNKWHLVSVIVQVPLTYGNWKFKDRLVGRFGYRVRRSELPVVAEQQCEDYAKQWAHNYAHYCATCETHARKLGARSTIVRAKLRNKSAYKLKARRRARHITNYLLRTQWLNDEFNHHLNLGLSNYNF